MGYKPICNWHHLAVCFLEKQIEELLSGQFWIVLPDRMELAIGPFKFLF
jgi:hypothetical protein